MSSDITVVICTIDGRTELLQRALRTVTTQTLSPETIVVSYDHDRLGHAGNRNKAMEKVTTEWVAFLDDDDELLPHHLETLYWVAIETEADLVYPWHQIMDIDGNPVPDILHHWPEFNPEELRLNNYIPVTVLVRAEAVRSVGGFPLSGPGLPWWKCEDWGCWRKMLDAGYRFVHTPEVTWLWHHWGGNTSGQPL